MSAPDCGEAGCAEGCCGNLACLPSRQQAQWWLAEVDTHGNPKLVDGAHADRSGADQAMVLYQRLGFAKGKQFKVARIELSYPQPAAVNEDALRVLNSQGLKP